MVGTNKQEKEEEVKEEEEKEEEVEEGANIQKVRGKNS